MATDLIRYVAEEIAADGPEGSSLERLNGFISNYSSNADLNYAEDQTIDEDVRRYVIETLTRLPNLFPGQWVGGVKPSSKKTNGSKSQKGKGKQAEEVDGEESENDEENGNGTSKTNKDAKMDHVKAHEEDRGKKLDFLIDKYGDGFRIAADKGTVESLTASAQDCTAAMAQLYYYTLRSRGDGVSFTELGTKFKYNASTSFFLTKCLTDCGLAIKYRAHNGKSNVSWIIAKRYAHLCPHLTASSTQVTSQESGVKEEDEDGDGDGDGEEGADDVDNDDVSVDPFSKTDASRLEEMTSEAIDEMVREGNRRGQNTEADQEDGNEDKIDEGQEAVVEDVAGLTTLHGLLAYPIIQNELQAAALLGDKAHVRMRLLRLLLASKNNATIRADLIIRIGIKDPNVMQRRLFNACLRQMEIEELIERCLLKRPLTHQEDHTEPCWMATAKGVEYHNQMTESSQLQEIKKLRLACLRELESNKNKIFVEMSFGRQILDRIESCQSAGMTIDRLNKDMGGNRDQRKALDHILANLKKPANLHYLDFTLFSALEQDGRKRSQRFWTRHWRPARVAPQEPRYVDGTLYNSWVGLPEEESFLNTDQWRRSKSVNFKRNLKREKPIGENGIGIDSSMDMSYGKRLKKPKLDENGEEIPIVKGRPKKNFTPGAAKAAERYQRIKALKKKEEEEKRGVEDLLCKPVSTRIASNSVDTQDLQGPSVVSSKASTDNQAQEKSQRKQYTPKSIQSEMGMDVPVKGVSTTAAITQGNMISLEAAANNIPDTLELAENGLSSSTSVDNEQANNQLSTRGVKAPRKTINLTLQIKYDTLQLFFREKQIIESTQFDSEYRRFVRALVGPDNDTQQHEMDRKVRIKLFSSLERKGIIQSKKVAAPVMSKGSQRIIWHLSTIDEAKMIEFCRQVSEGKVMNIRRGESVSGRVHLVLDSNQVDAPESIAKSYYASNLPSDRKRARSSARGASMMSEEAKANARALRLEKLQQKLLAQSGAPTARQAKSIRRKELAAHRQRIEEFDNVLHSCFDTLDLEEKTREVIKNGLVNIRREFGRGESGITLENVQQMFEEVLQIHKVGETNWNRIVNRKKENKKPAIVVKDLEDETSKVKGKRGLRARKAAPEWTRERDELLRDAVVILRCRDRHRNPQNPRKNWSALDQIFPNVSASSRNSRFEHLRKAVGEEAYLNQLEAEWDKLWSEFRGTDDLDDSNPADPANFDLKDHVEFLRSHIDKLAVASKVDNETGDPLPLNVRKMISFYDYERPPNVGYDPYSVLSRFSLSETSFEDKGRLLRGHALTLRSNAMGLMLDVDTPAIEQVFTKKQSKKERAKAIGIVKIIQCTKEVDYEEGVATKLCLDNVAEEVIERATKELQDVKVIKSGVKEDRQVPNRTFTFTQEYNDFHKATLETLPFWDIAKGYDGVVKLGQARVFRDFTDREAAAYLDLISQGRVDLTIDLSHVEKIKMEKLFNAKSLHDAQLELPITLQVLPSLVPGEERFFEKSETMLKTRPSKEPILQWLDEEVDSLPTRVIKAWEKWIRSLKGEDKALAKLLQKAFGKDSGQDGLKKQDLFHLCQSEEHLKKTLLTAQTLIPPLIFQSGYDEEDPFISAHQLPQWTIRFNSGLSTFAHKWYDIHGNWNEEVWRQSVRLVLYAIFTRPGISRAQLKTQFHIALDRSEMIRILQFACRAKVIRKVFSCNQLIQTNDDAEWEAKSDREIAFIAM